MEARIFKTFYIFFCLFAHALCLAWNEDGRVVNRDFWKTTNNENNLNQLGLILNPFSKCFVHLINYHGIDIPANLPTPLALSRYDYILKETARNGSSNRWDYLQTEWGLFLPEVIKPYAQGYDREDELVYLEHRTAKYRKWICSLQLYLLPPSEQDNLLWFQEIPRSYRKTWMNSVRSSFAQLQFFTSFSHPWYHLLISDRERVELEWNFAMNSVLEHHQTSHLMTLRLDLDNRISIACKFCVLNRRKYLAYVGDWNLKSLDNFLDKLDYNSRSTDWETGLNSFDRYKNFYAKPWDKVQQMTSFRGLVAEAKKFCETGAFISSSDVLIREVIGQNATFAKDDTPCLGLNFSLSETLRKCDSRLPGHSYPRFHLEETQALTLTCYSDYFTFLSCGELDYPFFNFHGYISAFDGWSWAFIGAFYVGLSTFLHIVFWVRGTGSEKDKQLPYFMGLKVLLEQGDDIAINSNRLNWMYWVCCVWILSAIVLQNGYKGKNIEAIMAPLTPKPFSRLTELDSQGFRLYSFPDMDFYYSSINMDDFGLPSNYDLQTEVRTLFNEMRNADLSNLWREKYTNKQMKLLEMNDYFGDIYLHKDAAEIHNAISTNSYSKIIGKCNNVALFGWWKDRLQGLGEIYNVLKNTMSKKQFSKVGKGEDDFFRRKSGWKLMRWGHKSILQRTYSLESSGIFAKWHEIEDLQKKLELLRKTDKTSEVETSSEVGLQLRGNLITVFVIYGICLSASIAVAAIELGIRLIIFVAKSWRIVLETSFSWLDKKFVDLWQWMNIAKGKRANIYA